MALRGIVLFLWGCQTQAQYWMKIVHPWVQNFYPVLGAGVWREAPLAFPDSSSVLDTCQSAIFVPKYQSFPSFEGKWPQQICTLRKRAEYCFESTVLEEGTHESWGKLGELCEKITRFCTVCKRIPQIWHTNPPFMPHEPFLLGVGLRRADTQTPTR